MMIHLMLTHHLGVPFFYRLLNLLLLMKLVTGWQNRITDVYHPPTGGHFWEILLGRTNTDDLVSSKPGQHYPAAGREGHFDRKAELATNVELTRPQELDGEARAIVAPPAPVSDSALPLPPVFQHNGVLYEIRPVSENAPVISPSSPSPSVAVMVRQSSQPEQNTVSPATKVGRASEVEQRRSVVELAGERLARAELC